MCKSQYIYSSYNFYSQLKYTIRQMLSLFEVGIQLDTRQLYNKCMSAIVKCSVMKSQVKSGWCNKYIRGSINIFSRRVKLVFTAGKAISKNWLNRLNSIKPITITSMVKPAREINSPGAHSPWVSAPQFQYLDQAQKGLSPRVVKSHTITIKAISKAQKAQGLPCHWDAWNQYNVEKQTNFSGIL